MPGALPPECRLDLFARNPSTLTTNVHPSPALLLRNRQRSFRLNLGDFQSAVVTAAKEVSALNEVPTSDIWTTLQEVEISVVSDRAIAKVHADFLNDPTPTDVITFEHGEILVSAHTAMREAKARGIPFERELLLYVLHGFLHLRGFDDHENSDRRRMHACQDRLLAKLVYERKIP